MVKKIEEPVKGEEVHKNTKANRFQKPEELQDDNKQTWPTDAVVYLGHLPHGFYEDQLKSYFSQYGDVLAVKVARSKKTARSKGYAFVQFRYPQVAQIVSDTMNGYLLLGKIIVSHALPANKKNPFTYSTSGQFKFINWKRLYIKQKNEPKTEEQTTHMIDGLLKNETTRKERFAELGIDYQYPGFASLIPKKSVESKKTNGKKAK